ncbi:alpha/beta fold hydrolase [Pseudomonas viridiflava]|uniref:alpha/beta fold hydrolase n=1 Tax=Pseudomonas viridiflava TaxID=33069 RepID=UPI000F068C05|nr:alpha/beta fold hydrolase [Pseudomonas viridiflava]
MATIDLPNGTHLHYEVTGEGPALLALAPGGLLSRAQLWIHREDGRPRGLVDPVHAFSARFKVITVDQRNTGGSHAPITAHDGWDEYAQDNLQLLDALGIERCHVLGACIGPSFALKMISLAPQRFMSAVLQQPIGKTAENLELRRASFQTWVKTLHQRNVFPAQNVLRAMEHNLFSTDFVYSVDRQFVSACTTPLLILPGDDARHPRVISEEILSLAPDAQAFEDWQSAAGQLRYATTLEQFFNQHTSSQNTSNQNTFNQSKEQSPPHDFS